MKLIVKDQGYEDRLCWGPDGLLPAVVQEAEGLGVLMLAYMNKLSLKKTLETGYTWFWSRSRGSLWQKGESSGNVQQVKEIYYDCDGDTLLVMVKQQGVGCHTGSFSCFHNLLAGDKIPEYKEIPGDTILAGLAATIRERRELRPEGSYVSRLFEKGLDEMVKKLGEEAVELVIAAKNLRRDEIVYESADLIFHLLVVLEGSGVELDQVLSELARRKK